MPKSNNRNVVRFPNRIQRLLQDSGIILFTIIIIYMFACFIIYMTKKHISVYEVEHGSISADYTYTGIALRTEQLVTADRSGYLTYYAAEGSKVGAKSTVMSIDETGELTRKMEESTSDSSVLSKEEILSLKETVLAFQKNYDSMNFSDTVRFKQSLESTILEKVQLKMLDPTSQVADASSMVNLYKAAKDGVLSYSVDGMETLSRDSITKKTFSTKNYKAEDLKKQELVNAGDTVYKLITEDDWSVVINTDKKTAKRLVDEGHIEVTFLKDNRSAWAKVDSWQSGSDTFVQLSFTNSMVRYATERYLDIRFNLDDVSGLKIPVSAVKKEEFYTIPIDYLAKAGDQDSRGVYQEIQQKDGSVSQKFTKLSIVYENETCVYVSMDDFSNGNTLLKPESTQRYQIGKTATLQGVYNINKGYTVFCPIEVVCKNQEYCIVRSDTSGGLSQYDRIVLEADTAEDNTAIY